MSRARWAANMTSSKRLGTCRMQSSTVTRAMATSDFPGAGGYTRPSSKHKGSQWINNLVGRQRRQEDLYRRASGRVPPVRRQVGKGSQDEGAILHPGMRQDCPPFSAGSDFSLIIKEIEVDQTGCVRHG